MNGISKLIVAVAGSVLINGVVFADQLTEVTVSAARETKIVVGHSAIGAPVEQITVTRRVSYADLDLASKSGADALEKRVNETAKSSCEDLDKHYPLETSTAGDCTNAAIKLAMVQVREAVSAAERRR
jgi:UrcA family protein